MNYTISNTRIKQLLICDLTSGQFGLDNRNNLYLRTDDGLVQFVSDEAFQCDYAEFKMTKIIPVHVKLMIQ